EEQRVHGGRVQPVRVVDEAQDRPLFGELGQDRQAGREDEKALLPSPRFQADSGPERGRLRAGKPVDVSEGGPQQLVERGEGELGLRLDAARGQDVHVGGAVASVLQQRRLAHAGLAAQDEAAATRSTSGAEQLADHGALGIPPVEHARIVSAQAARRASRGNPSSLATASAAASLYASPKEGTLNATSARESTARPPAMTACPAGTSSVAAVPKMGPPRTRRVSAGP